MIKSPPAVLVEKRILTQPRDRAMLDLFIDSAFKMACDSGRPVAVQEIEGQLCSFVCYPGYRPFMADSQAEYVTLLLPSEELDRELATLGAA